jgi:sulfite exporter TauE/SafE
VYLKICMKDCVCVCVCVCVKVRVSHCVCMCVGIVCVFSDQAEDRTSAKVYLHDSICGVDVLRLVFVVGEMGEVDRWW